MTASESLDLLRAGNERFVRVESQHPNLSPARRFELRLGQQPFAAVLGCADSRTAPELVFDRGLGDLFVLRSAGLALDDMLLGSLDYGVEHLHVPLVVALGHTSCGAVAATVEALDKHTEVHGALGAIVGQLTPAVAAARAAGDNSVDAAQRVHIQRTVELLRARYGAAVTVAGALYDLGTNEVGFLD